jgi:membrane associated rhomboid family serine protease
VDDGVSHRDVALPGAGGLWAVWAVAVPCIVIEAALQLADLGVVPVPRLRLIAYEFGGFWPGLLRDWRPNFTGQPVAMFATYALLHAGALHLVVNMLTLVSLGREVVARAGAARFLAVYGISALGGAMAFGLLASTLRPMVGASGALFGLAGALAAWEWRARRDDGVSTGPVLRFVGLLVVLNVILWWAMRGQLAWETHLGGCLAGAAAALVLREPSPDRGASA